MFANVTKAVLKHKGVKVEFIEVEPDVYKKVKTETEPYYTPDGESGMKAAEKHFKGCESFTTERVLLSMTFESFVNLSSESDVPENRKK